MVVAYLKTTNNKTTNNMFGAARKADQCGLDWGLGFFNSEKQHVSALYYLYDLPVLGIYCLCFFFF